MLRHSFGEIAYLGRNQLVVLIIRSIKLVHHGMVRVQANLGVAINACGVLVDNLHHVSPLLPL